MEKIALFILPILRLILNNVSPLIKDSLVTFVKELKAKAKQTPNEYDDLLVDFLAAILGVTL